MSNAASRKPLPGAYAWAKTKPTPHITGSSPEHDYCECLDCETVLQMRAFSYQAGWDAAMSHFRKEQGNLRPLEDLRESFPACAHGERTAHEIHGFYEVGNPLIMATGSPNAPGPK